MTCAQAKCSARADYHFMWPGQGWRPVCAPHARQVRGLAITMGFQLPLMPVLEYLNECWDEALAEDSARRLARPVLQFLAGL